MKWLPFSILALIALILQTTIARSMAIYAIWPDIMFILAVHYALWAPWPEGAIAAWILGLLLGDQSKDSLGLHAFCFGAAAWIIIQFRQVLFRDHVVTQFAVTFVFACCTQLIVLTFRAWQNSHAASWTDIVWPMLFAALYTAILAPYLHWLLLRMSRWTGLRTGQRPGGYRY